MGASGEHAEFNMDGQKMQQLGWQNQEANQTSGGLTTQDGRDVNKLL